MAERTEPKKIGKPIEKTEAEKKKDAKLLAELEKENSPDHVETDDYVDFNPHAAQAERLPAGIKGADGYDPNSHVSQVGGGVIEPTDRGESFSDDDDLGGGVGDASSLTAD